MENAINDILNEMAGYLNAEQQRILQKVLISRLAENKPSFEKTTNADYQQLFLDAKKVEGCSLRTLLYYGTTLTHFFGEVTEPVRKISTERIRKYLADYQQINNQGIIPDWIKCLEIGEEIG